MQYISKYTSPLGAITLASNGEALTGLWFDGQKYFGANLSKEYKNVELPVFKQTKEWLNLYFNGQKPDFIPLLALQASEFRLAVWQILLEIPYGQTLSYGDISAVLAKQKGLKTMSTQAVGGAVGHNPISIIIPCHRVVGSNGNLTGYAGGLEKKIALLQLEGADMGALFTPKKGTAL